MFVIPQVRYSAGPLHRRLVIPQVRYSEGSLFRRSVTPNVRYSAGPLLRRFEYSEGPLLRRSGTPKVRYSAGSLFRLSVNPTMKMFHHSFHPSKVPLIRKCKGFTILKVCELENEKGFINPKIVLMFSQVYQATGLN